MDHGLVCKNYLRSFFSEQFLSVIFSIKEKRILATDNYLVITKHDKNQNKLSFKTKNSPRIHAAKKTQYPACKRTKLSKSPVKEKAPVLPNYSDEYKCFKQKIEEFKLPDHVCKFQHADELEKEKLKHLLSDWIFWTSRNKADDIDHEDLNIFRGFLIYLLNTQRQLEKLAFIFKILKRLIEKNGSFEWIETYKELYTSIQSEFYIEFDSTIRFD